MPGTRACMVGLVGKREKKGEREGWVGGQTGPFGFNDTWVRGHMQRTQSDEDHAKNRPLVSVPDANPT